MFESGRKGGCHGQCELSTEGARYHVLSRGDRREDIVFDDGDRNSFVETLGEAATRANWQVHAFCLMRKDDPEVGKLLSRGWRFGAEDFLDRLEERVMGALSDNHDPEQVAEMMQVRVPVCWRKSCNDAR